MSARRIVITSGKGGVGKTTTTLNLGAALATAGHRVLLIDGDLGLRNLDLAMGLERRVVFDLVDIVKGRCRMHQAIIADKRFRSLAFLPAGKNRDQADITENQFAHIVKRLGNLYDYILIDCPAGIERAFRNAVAGASEAVVVTTPEVSAIRDAHRIIADLRERDILFTVLVNRVRPEMVATGDMMNVDDIASVLESEILGVVPDDEEIIDCTNRGEIIATLPKSRLAKIYDKIARRLNGDDIPLTKFAVPSIVVRIFGDHRTWTAKKAS